MCGVPSHGWHPCFCFGENIMAVAGSMVWAFSCKILEEEGQSYLVTGERSYYPKDNVMDPKEVVEVLMAFPDQVVWCRLLGTNNKDVKAMWDNRKK